MAIPSMGVSHTESLSMVGVAIQAFAYDLNFKHWQDCVLKLLVSSPCLNCVILYHWFTWSKCFKAVEHQEPPATWHRHLAKPSITRWQAWEAWREQPQGRTAWIHICIYGPLMRWDFRWGKKMGEPCVIQHTTCLVHGSTHPWFIYMLYFVIDHNMIITVCIVYTYREQEMFLYGNLACVKWKGHKWAKRQRVA